MRILAYSDSKVFSGAEMIFCEIARGLGRSPSLDLVGVAPAENARLAEALRGAVAGEVLDAPAQAIPLGALDLYNPLRRSRVRKTISEVNPDVLLVNLPSAEYGGLPLGLPRGRWRRIGLLHVPGSPRELGFRLGRMREALARRVLRGLDAVWLFFDAAVPEFEARWGGHGLELRRLPSPRPSTRLQPREEARRSLGLPDGEIVGIAGRISFKQKGHDTFVEAAELLAASRPGLRFAVAGDGRDRARLERVLSERGLRDRFFLLGSVEPIDSFLSAIDAIVIPSRFEGLPLIALEALAGGLPGVATRVDGLGEIWPAPWQIAPDDPRGLTEAVARVLEAPPALRARLLEQGRAAMERATSLDMGAAVEPLLKGRADGG